jgi:hypothetical protein
MEHYYNLTVGSICLLHPHKRCTSEPMRPILEVLYHYFDDRLYNGDATYYEYRILERISKMRGPEGRQQ